MVSYPSGVDPSDIAWKDAKKYGSYIEVKAYYNSNNSTEKQGEITYRFMLGKDTPPRLQRRTQLPLQAHPYV